MWVGTTRGLSRFDDVDTVDEARPDTVVNFTTADGLGADNIESLMQEADGTLWIATRGGGLSRWRDGEITTFSSQDGLLDDELISILDDGNGYLWLSTIRGIFRVAKADLEAFAEGRLERLGGIAYGRRDGLKNETCYGGQGASLATRDGRLWFATLDGVAVVDPSRLEHIPAPMVVVEQVSADGSIVQRLEALPPKSRTVELRFAAPTLLVPGKIKLRYRLRGFENDWRLADGSRTASYNNLAPRRYVFEATASDERGRWNGDVTSFTFRVEPAFYQTTAFRVCCILALALLAFALHNARTRQLRRRARELSGQVEQALAKVRVLRGLLPICASCKRIRDRDDGWTHLENYIDAHSEAAFTHGICPDCAGEYLDTEVE